MSRRRVIRASDLAKLVICEQKALFERLHREALTPEQEQRIADGNRGHAGFLEQAFAVNPSVGSSEKKPWCFVASCVFGQAAPETVALRAFRDRVLRRTVAGRALIRLYYRRSPAAVRLIDQHAWVRPPLRLLLRAAAAVSAWILGKTG